MLLEDVADVAVVAALGRRRGAHSECPVGGFDEPADDSQKRRLAAPRGTDDGDELARLDAEVDALDRGDGVEGDGDAVEVDHAV